MQIQKHSVAAFLILALGAALIGIAPIFVRLSELSPSWILFYRMLLNISGIKEIKNLETK